MTSVLVAQDERDGLGPASSGLEGIGFGVTVVDLASCLEAAAGLMPALVIVDLGNAESRGLRLCAQLRAHSGVPVIAVGGDDRWLVPALSAGADDYLPKPLDLPTLVAKMLAILRRCSYAAKSQRVIEIGDLVVDLDRCQVTLKGQPLPLAPVEYRILAALARRAGRVLSCPELIKEAQGYDTDEQEARDIIKLHIYRLRRKMGAYESEADYVVTVPGFGYMLERWDAPRPDTPSAGWARRRALRPASAERAV